MMLFLKDVKNQAKNIRWGIIGLGNIANKFAQATTKMNNCELLAVSSRDKQNLLNLVKNIVYQKNNSDSYENL